MENREEVTQLSRMPQASSASGPEGSSRLLVENEWYFFVGPEKTGTTWIHELLSANAEVLLPAGVKETFFFDRYYEKGMDWYLSHFKRPRKDAPGPRKIVDVAPSYFNNSRVAERIKRHVLRPTIICTLRDPVARSLSLYQHLHRYGWTNRSLAEAIEQYPFLVTGSQYHARLVEWWRVFGEGSVHVLFYDDLAGNPAGFSACLQQLLHLDALEIGESAGRVVNQAGGPRSYWLAKSARLVATWLRESRAYAVIEILRRLGLKEVLYGGRAAGPVHVAAEDVKMLRSLLSEDLGRLRSAVHSVPSAWGEC